MAKKTRKPEIPQDTVLAYKPGELIIKEGDFGVSIYRIRSGKVLIFLESSVGDIPITRLEEGQIFGEMAFLTGIVSKRSASARALEPTELDVWHPLSLKSEYDKMPYILKYILNQTFYRIVKVNDYIVKLEEQLDRAKQPIPYFSNRSRRQFYRQPVDLDCAFRLARDAKANKFWAKVEDISNGGARLNIKRMSLVGTDVTPGDQFKLDIFLSQKSRIAVTAELAFQKLIRPESRYIMGVCFKEMSKESEDALRFFLK